MVVHTNLRKIMGYRILYHVNYFYVTHCVVSLTCYDISEPVTFTDARLQRDITSS